MNFKRLQELIDKKRNPTVMGLDITAEMIPDGIKSGDIHIDLVNYAAGLIDACADIVPAVKPNCAFYERYGRAGLLALDEVIKIARDAGLYVILDAKRGDIGNTCDAYAEAYLSPGAEKPDALTVNPYMGSESVLPFSKLAAQNDKSIFVLTRTSNPSAADFEDLTDKEGKPLYLKVAERVKEWNDESGCVGAVCGATHPRELATLRSAMPGVFFLIPGYGAQGGGAKDAMPGFEVGSKNAIVNASRSIIAAWKKTDGQDFKTAARDSALRMKEDLSSALGI